MPFALVLFLPLEFTSFLVGLVEPVPVNFSLFLCVLASIAAGYSEILPRITATSGLMCFGLPPAFHSISALLYVRLHFISWRFVLMDFAAILP